MKEEAVTIDNVQETVDSLVLSLFEGMRASALEGSDNAQVAENFAIEYVKATEIIDSLVGVSKSKAELHEELRNVDDDYKQTVKRVMELEKELKEVEGKLEGQLVSQLN